MTYYAYSNRAGKLLAYKLKGQREKTKIPFLYHPSTNVKRFHPQAIANAFSDYYSSLYNLHKDPNTC